MAQLTWKRNGRGRQVSTCGRYAVESMNATNEACDYTTRMEWAAITTHNDDNLDWFDTAREAKAECQRHADRHDMTVDVKALQNAWEDPRVQELLTSPRRTKTDL